MYISLGQVETAHKGQSFDVNINSFICCKFQKHVFIVLFYAFFFHDLIHVYSPEAGAEIPRGQNLMSTERPYHFTHLLQVSKKSL